MLCQKIKFPKETVPEISHQIGQIKSEPRRLRSQSSDSPADDDAGGGQRDARAEADRAHARDEELMLLCGEGQEEAAEREHEPADDGEQPRGLAPTHRHEERPQQQAHPETAAPDPN